MAQFSRKFKVKKGNHHTLAGAVVASKPLIFVAGHLKMTNPRIDSYEIDLDCNGAGCADQNQNELNSHSGVPAAREFAGLALNIDGGNTLACLKSIEDVKGEVNIYPLPHIPVVKDLVPDLTHAYAQLTSVEPWLKTETPDPKGRERKYQKNVMRWMDYGNVFYVLVMPPPVRPTGGMVIAVGACRIVASLSLDSR